MSTENVLNEEKGNGVSADVIQSLPNGKQIPSDEVLLDFIDWFGTWQTDKPLEDYGINDILDAYKLDASKE
jgi:hypothetical protein